MRLVRVILGPSYLELGRRSTPPTCSAAEQLVQRESRPHRWPVDPSLSQAAATGDPDDEGTRGLAPSAPIRRTHPLSSLGFPRSAQPPTVLANGLPLLGRRWRPSQEAKKSCPNDYIGAGEGWSMNGPPPIRADGYAPAELAGQLGLRYAGVRDDTAGPRSQRVGRESDRPSARMRGVGLTRSRWGPSSAPELRPRLAVRGAVVGRQVSGIRRAVELNGPKKKFGPNLGCQAYSFCFFIVRFKSKLKFDSSLIQISKMHHISTSHVFAELFHLSLLYLFIC
jgi:hypothetical protein